MVQGYMTTSQLCPFTEAGRTQHCALEPERDKRMDQEPPDQPNYSVNKQNLN